VRYYYINGRFLTQSPTGVQRYATELVTALDDLIASGDIDAEQLKFIILTPHNLIRTLNLKHIPLRRVGRFSGHLWEQVELPRYARHGLLINLCNTGPALASHQMITIHDTGFMAMPASYTYAFRTWYRLLLRRLGQTAVAIVTGSEFSRRELIEHLRIPAARIHVIHHGREHIERLAPDDSVITDHHLDRRPFLLTVSSMSPRKNFQTVMRAVEKLEKVDFDVVVAGGSNPRVFADSGGQLPDYVRTLGYVTDGELKSLYSHAAAFIYPSLYEGFGLPPLEAMACGCPVIVSDIPPHREICGEAALYCDPHDIKDMGEKIVLIMKDGCLRRRLIESGGKRKQLFGWKEAAISFRLTLEDGH